MHVQESANPHASLYETLGLQRARVRSIALRADDLRPDDRATRQLTLDNSDDKPLAIEAVADRARARYGHQVLYPAALATTATPAEARLGNGRAMPPGRPSSSPSAELGIAPLVGYDWSAARCPGSVSSICTFVQPAPSSCCLRR